MKRLSVRKGDCAVKLSPEIDGNKKRVDVRRMSRVGAFCITRMSPLILNHFLSQSLFSQSTNSAIGCVTNEKLLQHRDFNNKQN